MKKIALSLAVLATALLVQFFAAPASAASCSSGFCSYRTWVSATGDDSNVSSGCQPAAPCRSISAAFSATFQGGEVNCAGPAESGDLYNYTTITINYAVTIDCHGSFGGHLSLFGRNGVVINAPGAVVTLRGLNLDGFSDYNSSSDAGNIAVLVQAAAAVNIEDCVIENFAQGGISVTTAANTILDVDNTTIRNVPTGVSLAPTGGAVNGSIDHTKIAKTSGNGITTSGSVYFTVTNSRIVNAAGVGVNAGAGAVLEVDSSSVSNNRTAFATNGGVIRISHNLIYDNTANYSIAGGVIATAGNNSVAVNGSTVPNGSVTQQ